MALRRVGSVPEMLSCEDFLDGGFEEKAVVLYVAQLCSRLLQLSKEDRAACIITQAFRRLAWLRKYGEWLAAWLVPCLLGVRGLNNIHTPVCTSMHGPLHWIMNHVFIVEFRQAAEDKGGGGEGGGARAGSG